MPDRIHLAHRSIISTCGRKETEPRESACAAFEFAPKPTDKHAADPKEAAKPDNVTHNELHKGLEDIFPASDPAPVS